MRYFLVRDELVSLLLAALQGMLCGKHILCSTKPSLTVSATMSHSTAE